MSPLGPVNACIPNARESKVNIHVICLTWNICSEVTYPLLLDGYSFGVSTRSFDAAYNMKLD